MTTYITYQCSICRRTKDIAQDNVRVLPNQCTITKGCAGSLYKIGETLSASTVDPVSGLTDWYPRGQTLSQQPALPAPQTQALTCSSSGALTLALLLSDADAAANSTITLALQQRLSADVPSTEYVYNVTTTTSIISGKDSAGKNLRFDQNSIDNDLIHVLVNGVARQQGVGANDYTASPNVITLNTPITSGIVVVSVFGVAPTVPQQLSFSANYSFIATANAGSWGNIRWVDEYDPATGSLRSNSGKKWWLYTCTSVSNLATASMLKITSIKNGAGNIDLMPGTLGAITNARFMIAAPPYGNTDRYLNFSVDVEALSDDYLLTSATGEITELFAAGATIELYPPYQLFSAPLLISSSYVVADTFPTNDSVSDDTPESRLVSSKIIGPV